MTAAGNRRQDRIWELTIESDWLTTLCMGFVLAICASLLARDIHETVRGQFAGPGTLHKTFNGILLRIGEVIAAVYCFMAGLGRVGDSKTIGKAVRFAFVLMGIYFTTGAALGIFHATVPARHAAAVARAIVEQVALVIFCVAIAEWFRSVFHWRKNSELNGDRPDSPLA